MKIRKIANISFTLSMICLTLYYMYELCKATDDIFTPPIAALCIICLLIYGFFHNLDYYTGKAWLSELYVALCAIIAALFIWKILLMFNGKYTEPFEVFSSISAFFREPGLFRFRLLSDALLLYVEAVSLASGIYLIKEMRKGQK